MNNYIKKIYENNDIKILDKLANNINNNYNNSEESEKKSTSSKSSKSDCFSFNNSSEESLLNNKYILTGGTNDTEQNKYITICLIGLAIIIFIDTCNNQ